MQSKLKNFLNQSFFAAIILLVSIPASADKDKNKEKSSSAPPPAPPVRSTPHTSGGGGSSNANSGGGRPSSGGATGRPATNPYNSGGNSGRPSYNGNNGGGNSGRPNSSGTGHPENSANNGTPYGRPSGNSGGTTTGTNNTYNHPGTSGGTTGTNNTYNHPGTSGGTTTGTNNTYNHPGTSGGTTTGTNNTYNHPGASGGTTTGTTYKGGEPGRRPGDTHTPDHGSGRDASHADKRHEPVFHEEHVGNNRVLRDDRGHARQIYGHDARGRDIAIHHDFRGGARFETRAPNGRRIVGYGHGRGFTERAYLRRNNRVYVQRTYVYGGRRYAVVYRSYNYRGVVYYHYAPTFYYHPVFYGWAYNPWAAPVYYRWGWYGDPWYPAYGYYFAPYPVYPSASLWLTDYLLAENLRLAYEARANAEANAYNDQVNAPPPQNAQVTLTPEVKQMIADEVQRQLAEERAAAQQNAPALGGNSPGLSAQPVEDVPPALQPNQRVFIVASNLELAGDQGECAVTAGDVLMRMGTAPNEQNKIAVNVVSSKQGDCPANTNADVEVTELQEMHNQFREKLDSGLKTLADNQGKNGLPLAPDTQTIPGEVPRSEPDPDAASELQDQQKSVEQTEHEVQKVSPGASLYVAPANKPMMAMAAR